MGAGYHGGFGHTYGTRNSFAFAMSPTFAGDDNLKNAAKILKPEPGYTDIIVHGNPNTLSATILHNGKWVDIDQRRLAKMFRKDKEYSEGPVRLVSCYSGSENGTFAQNLANKLGVEVMAPSDKLYILANGKTSIGPVPYKNTGTWIHYHPYGNGRKDK